METPDGAIIYVSGPLIRLKEVMANAGKDPVRKEMICMRWFFVAAAAMVFVLAFATAFADEMPVMTESREIGALLNSEAPGHVVMAQPKRFRGDLLYTPEDLLPV